MTNELRSMTTRQAWSLGAIGALLLTAALILVADTWTGFGFDADGEEMTRLTAALSLRPGMVVADIGAGQGQLSAALAKVVGPAGHVFSTDIDPGRVQRLRETTAAAGLGNVTVLAATARESGLSASCCEAIVVRRVYHHLSDSPATIASLLRGLRSGGLLAVIDFPPPPLFFERSGFGVPAQIVVDETRAAGLEVVRLDSDWPGRGPLGSYFVLLRKS